MKAWVALGFAIIAEVCGSLSLKAAQTQPAWVLVVAVGYLGSLLALAYALRCGMPLGLGYGVWGAAGVALTALGAAVVFGEPLTVMMVGGIGLIMVGVLLMELGSRAGAPESAKQHVPSRQTAPKQVTR